MEVDEKPSIGMPPPVPTVLLRMLPGEGRLSGGSSLREEGMFVLRVAERYKKNFWRATRRGSGGCLGAHSPLYTCKI